MLGCAKRRAHNDHRAWGETRCPSQTETSQDRLGWGVGRWCGLGAGSWPWHWVRRVGLGLAAALIGTSALSTLNPPPLVHCWRGSRNFQYANNFQGVI